MTKTPSVLGTSLSRRSTASLPTKAGFVVAGDDPWYFIPSFPGASVNLPALEAAARGIGAINWLPDRDQIVRPGASTVPDWQ
jgi:adenylate cyclase